MGEPNQLVSVIVPAYNVGPFIEKCVRSIMAQSHRELEIIIVDDGSTDNTGRICNTLAAEDDRICIIHKQNGGLSDARNTGIEASCGKWLMFIDGDDFIDSDMVEILLKRAIEDSADITICGFRHTSEDGVPTKEDSPGDNTWDESTFWDALYDHGIDGRECLAAVWNKLYARNLFDNERFDACRLCEDAYILHRLISVSKTIATVSPCCYNYVSRDGSIMHTLDVNAMMDGAEALVCRASYLHEKGYRQAMACALGGALYFAHRAMPLIGTVTEKNRWCSLLLEAQRLSAHVPIGLSDITLLTRIVFFRLAPSIYCSMAERTIRTVGLTRAKA